MPRLVFPTYKVIVSRMVNFDVAYSVVQLADGSWENVTDYKPDNPRYAGALNVFLGGREYDLTGPQAAALTAAGYTVE